MRVLCDGFKFSPHFQFNILFRNGGGLQGKSLFDSVGYLSCESEYDFFDLVGYTVLDLLHDVSLSSDIMILTVLR